MAKASMPAHCFKYKIHGVLQQHDTAFLLCVAKPQFWAEQAAGQKPAEQEHQNQL
jgi:hypothetical protein